MSRVFTVVALIASCASRNSSPSAAAVTPEVVLHPAGQPEVHVKVELARTDAERMRGLMYREKLEPDHGMLFLFDEEQQQTFWMKNTYIPLDIIFIKADLTVLGTAANAEPMTTSHQMVPGKSQFVLEVNAGFAQAHGIVPGTKVEFLHVK